jgi:UDP-N-acetylmuramoyl-L-alanyl-D-glutamate--2,6-diaminopimelate ligase
MKLSDLHRLLEASASGPLEIRQADPGSAELQAAAFDSRRVRPGDLFCALPGAAHDGRAFLAAAEAAGAAAVLSTGELATSLPTLAVPAAELRRLAALAAHALAGEPSRELWVGAVTGTNGKSTVVHLTASALQACGLGAARAGTLGFEVPGVAALPDIVHTTPEADDLVRWLAATREAGHRHALLEASSHGLDLERLAGLAVDAAAWTNLSHDHLDYHGDLASYAAAKAKLFHALPAGAPAFHPLEADIEGALAGMAATSVPWTLDEGDGRATHAALRGTVRCRPEGLRLDIDGFYGQARIDSPLIGRHNAENLLVAFGMASAAGAPREAVAAALSQVGAAPGRLERVTGPEGCHLFVDYAHTPDALAHVLAALREQFPGQRLGAVFGAGGDRDPSKRALMGEAVAAHADWCVVTSDNPRTEDPAAIAAMVAAGVATLPEASRETILDRRTAIREAVARLCPGDVLLVAGKGHETYQEVDGVRRPFDDRVELREALACFL